MNRKFDASVAKNIRDDYFINHIGASKILKKYNISKSHFYNVVKNKIWSVDNFDYYLNQPQPTTKICGTCKIEKKLSSFSKKKSRSDGLSSICKDCAAIENKQWNDKNRKNYYVSNKTVIIQRAVKYLGKKYKTDIAFRLRNRISSTIRNHLFIYGSSKNGKSILKYLPYNIDELKQYLENQFDTWMTWDNYGQYNPNTWNDSDPVTWVWNIDHIMPQSDLPYTSMEDDNFKKCWALNNLRPYSAKQNLIDGTNRTRHGDSNE